jgi:hypothetical protein
MYAPSGYKGKETQPMPVPNTTGNTSVYDVDFIDNKAYIPRSCFINIHRLKLLTGHEGKLLSTVVATAGAIYTV